MQLSQPVIWSIACHHQSWIMRFHILSCFLRNPCILSHFEFLALLVLFMTFLLIVINCLRKLSSVYFWGTPEFKNGIDVDVHIHIAFKSLQMLLSLRIHLSLRHQLPQNLILTCYQFLYLNLWENVSFTILI